MRSLFLIITLVGSIAVADSKPPPAKPEISAEDAKKAEAFFNDFYAAVMTNQAACPKMGPSINKAIDKHLVLLLKLADSGKEMPQAVKDRMEHKQKEMMSALFKCKDDKAVQVALQRWVSLATTRSKPSH